MAGTRPDLIRLASLMRALERRREVRQLLVHSGQHRDPGLVEDVARDVGTPDPRHHLGVGSGSHAEQTAAALDAFERLVAPRPPDVVVVRGGTNTALGCALAAAKLGIPIVQLEGGLRRPGSGAEQLNRLLVDRLADTLLVPAADAELTLVREGIADTRVRVVGSTAVDAARRAEPAARLRRAWRDQRLEPGTYVLAAFRRPEHVDDPQRLAALTGALGALARHAPVLLALHPRTRARLGDAGLLAELSRAGVRCLPAQPYVPFVSLMLGAGAVVTDSGGVQEETSALGVRCFTLGSATDRPGTLAEGTNELLGDDPEALAAVRPDPAAAEPLSIAPWDGLAGERAARQLTAHHVLVRGRAI